MDVLAKREYAQTKAAEIHSIGRTVFMRFSYYVSYIICISCCLFAMLCLFILYIQLLHYFLHIYVDCLY